MAGAKSSKSGLTPAVKPSPCFTLPRCLSISDKLATFLGEPEAFWDTALAGLRGLRFHRMIPVGPGELHSSNRGQAIAALDAPVA